MGEVGVARIRHFDTRLNITDWVGWVYSSRTTK